MKMLYILEFLLFLSGAMRDKTMKCDDLKYKDVCWSSQADDYVNCWQCIIRNHQIAASDKEFLIYYKFAKELGIDVGSVIFVGGDFPRMPKLVEATTKQPILALNIYETNTRVLNAQFFGNAGGNLTYFGGRVSNKLSLEAFAFQSCASLEVLDLERNKISSISPDAFLGLHKLIRLELGRNQLSLVNKGWFRDLSKLERLDLRLNQLKEISDESFAALTKLKRLNLNSNNIEIVSRKTFKHNEQLQLIDMKHNQIKQIQVDTFAHLSQLTRLDLDFNDCIDNNFDNKTLAKIAKALTACHSTICKIPQITNGFVINIEDNVTQTPGEYLGPFDSVKVVCDPSFIQFHEKVYKCTQKDWNIPLWPTCERK